MFTLQFGFDLKHEQTACQFFILYLAFSGRENLLKISYFKNTRLVHFFDTIMFSIRAVSRASVTHLHALFPPLPGEHTFCVDFCYTLFQYALEKACSHVWQQVNYHPYPFHEVAVKCITVECQSSLPPTPPTLLPGRFTIIGSVLVYDCLQGRKKR